MTTPAGMPEPRPPRLILGDCLEVMRGMEAGSVDAVVTDPPYDLTSGNGRGFMGKAWDGTGVAFRAETWAEVLRLLRPGGYLLSMGGTRTYHRMTCAIEDAGFTIRDSIHWVYSQGFPKGKACLKPAHEPIVLAMKPGGKVRPLNIDACRVAIADIGADGRAEPGKYVVAPGDVYEGGWSRDSNLPAQPHAESMRHDARGRYPSNLCLTHHPACRPAGTRKVKPGNGSGVAGKRTGQNGVGNWGYGPADEAWGGYVSPDGTEVVAAWECAEGCPVRMLDAQTTDLHRAGNKGGTVKAMAGYSQGWSCRNTMQPSYGDRGGASRFFPTFSWEDADFFPIRYVAKASRRERNEGLEGMPIRSGPNMNHAGRDLTNPRNFIPGGTRDRVAKGLPPVEPSANHHPTVKPLSLMKWLCRLITPPGGTVLDPFMGSGTTGLACMAEGFGFVGIESDPEYHRIASRRLAAAAASTPLFAGVAPSDAP